MGLTTSDDGGGPHPGELPTRKIQTPPVQPPESPLTPPPPDSLLESPTPSSPDSSPRKNQPLPYDPELTMDDDPTNPGTITDEVRRELDEAGYTE